MKTAFKTGGAPTAPSEYESPKMKIVRTMPQGMLCGSNGGGVNNMWGDCGDPTCESCDFE